jgi:GntR family transcriptional regulator
MIFEVNFKAGLPVYLQIVEQVKAAAASGQLKPGDPLPSIRPLAEELHLNRNTIAKAYGELEAQGVVETQPGKGCFISENHSPLKKEIRRKMLAEQIDALLVSAHHLQIEGEELTSLIRQRQTLFEERSLKTDNKE